LRFDSEMQQKRVSLDIPEGYNYGLSIFSGWSQLTPFAIEAEERTLSRVQVLSSGKIVRATTREDDGGAVTVDVECGLEPDVGDLEEVRRVFEVILRLDEDFSSLYDLLGGYSEFAWVEEVGAGRSIRCPTVFEDVVKTICTTNASWGLTKGIVRRLCERLGAPFSGELYAFPLPEALSSSTEEILRAEVKSGYRSPYLLELGMRVADGELEVEAWSGSPLGSAALKKEVLAVKGVGEYAANNILHLLGRHDFLALDSWMRRRFAELHNDGEPASDGEIEEHYAPFGEWRGLVMNLDMSKEYILKRIQ
jgi:3-methyladenine DNA glycosylase/8-oxoguanine DNA glycosylase